MNLDQISEEEFYLLALACTEGIGSIRSHQLLAKFQTAVNIFQASKKELFLSGLSIPEKSLEAIYNKTSLKLAEKELQFCKKNDISIVSPFHTDYPARLKYVTDRPLILFKKGNIHSQTKKSIAIVGTRKSTDYGHRFLESLFQELKSIKDIVVISGLAHGIDYKSHILSVEHQIPTLAVMGLALDKIYPSAHTNLAQKILQSNGGWVTETSSQDITKMGVFPKRNRIIAGLCDALLVVETDVKGGSIITARMANDYQKEVFAVPGRITDAQSRGCNDLIQKNFATTVNSSYDVIEFMNWAISTNKSIPKSIEFDFQGSTLQKKILDTIRQFPRIDIENLGVKTNSTHSELVEVLLDLELDNWIVTLPGNQYEIR